jgi:hypothetical protein
MAMSLRSAAAMAGGLAVAAGLAGCMVRVDKDASGKEKKVQVDTLFGGIHVNTNQTTATDLGLPVYPGATMVEDKEHNQSADVHLGFGEFQLRVRAVSYETPDPQDKVIAFYRKGLNRYGEVITCKDNAPVGAPAATHEGLTCADNEGNGNVRIGQGDYHISKGDLELKAGSKRHQHILGFENSVGGKTRFALVALDLPSEITESGTGKSD